MTFTMSAHRISTQPFGRIIGTELIHGRPVRTYRRGRVSGSHQCRTQLSLYNPKTLR
jgi:hypothetical protein